MTGLLDLPNEILAEIFSYLSENDLYSLTLLSRRIHHVAIPVYLAWHGVKNCQDDILISANETNNLTVLRLALFISSIRRLHCEFRSTWLLRDMQELARFLDKLTRLEEVVLDFKKVRFWNNGEISFQGQSVNYLALWREHLTQLLTKLQRKSCVRITVNAGSVLDGTIFDGRAEDLRSSLPLIVRLRAIHREPRHVFRKVFKRTPGGKEFQENQVDKRHDHGVAPGVPAFSDLQELHLTSSLLSQPTFLRWGLDTLRDSSHSLTRLSLCEMILNPEVWCAFLSRITLPRLAEFSINPARIAPTDLFDFINRHPIKKISFKGGRLMPEILPTPVALTPATQSRLGFIHASPHDVTYILQHDGPFESLTTVSLWRNYDTSPDFAFHQLARAKTCHPIHLIIQNFFNLSEEPGSRRALSCVASISLVEITLWVLARPLEAIPRWLADFPALKDVNIFAWPVALNVTDDRVLFIESARSFCPGLESVKLVGSDESLVKWVRQDE
jgi:hypothetical protein